MARSFRTNTRPETPDLQGFHGWEGADQNRTGDRCVTHLFTFRVSWDDRGDGS